MNDSLAVAHQTGAQIISEAERIMFQVLLPQMMAVLHNPEMPKEPIAQIVDDLFQQVDDWQARVRPMILIRHHQKPADKMEALIEGCWRMLQTYPTTTMFDKPKTENSPYGYLMELLSFYTVAHNHLMQLRADIEPAEVDE